MSHTDRTHAKYSASNAARWLVCPGQPAFAATFPPQPSSKYAEEGTLAHEELERCLTDGYRYSTHRDLVVRESVNAVVDYVQDLREAHPDLVIRAETYLDFPQSVVPREDCGGTTDLVAFTPDLRFAWVVDFKHGAGVAVDAEDNKQLLFYGAAALLGADLPDQCRVTLAIIQPRAFHPKGPVREWSVEPWVLMDFAMEVDVALREGEADATYFRAGPHCHWCPCRAACPEAERDALAVLRDNFADVKSLDDVVLLPDPKTIDAAKLARIQAGRKALADWLDAVEGEIVSQLKQGGFVPGWKLTTPQARRKWIPDEAKVAAELMALSGHTLGPDDVMPRKLAGITEMEKALVRVARATAPKGAKDAAAEQVRDALARLTDKQPGAGYVLVPGDSPRVTVTPATQTFAGVVVPPVETGGFETPLLQTPEGD